MVMVLLAGHAMVLARHMAVVARHLVMMAHDLLVMMVVVMHGLRRGGAGRERQRGRGRERQGDEFQGFTPVLRGPDSISGHTSCKPAYN